MSLVAVREGLLVLIADHNNYHLGVLYFPSDIPISAVYLELTEAHKRCRLRFENCNWKLWSSLQSVAQPIDRRAHFSMSKDSHGLEIEDSIEGRSVGSVSIPSPPGLLKT